MTKKGVLALLLVLPSLAFSQAAETIKPTFVEETAPQPEGSVLDNRVKAEQYQSCVKAYFGLDLPVSYNGVIARLDLPTGERVFAENIDCSDNKLIMSNFISLKGVGATSSVGSAIKADTLTIWPPKKSSNCPHPNLYGVDAVNIRWFNWDDKKLDGGNQQFEIVKTTEGTEVRIGTLSHFRATDLVWKPKNSAITDCGVEGDLALVNLDARWSSGGNTRSYYAEQAALNLALPSSPEDAKTAKGGISITAKAVNLDVKNANEVSQLRAQQPKLTVTTSVDSVMPWSLLAQKYFNPMFYRQQDSSLIDEVFPADLANTFHLTTGKATVSLPSSTITPTLFFPLSSAMDFTSVGLNSMFTSFEGVAGINKGKGEAAANFSISGVGKASVRTQFLTQMFNKDLLRAISKGTVDIKGRTGPGVISLEATMTDEGFVSSFVSLMKAKPSSWLLRTMNTNIGFWQSVSKTLQAAENGETVKLSLKFTQPQVYMNGFWKNAWGYAEIVK